MSVNLRQAPENQARLLKTLAHPTRLRLLHALRDGEQCVCHLTALLGQRQAYVSQQLMFLRRSGVLEDRRDGTRVYYRVRDPHLFELLDLMNALVGARVHVADPAVVPECSCPRCQGAPSRQKQNGRK